MKALVSAVMATLLILGGCVQEDAAVQDTGGSTVAETGGEVPVLPMPTDPRAHNSGYSETEKVQCTASGGTYQRAGMAGQYNCITPYADAGKVCRASSECEGQCRVDMNAEEGAAGQCQRNSNPFGCYGFYDEEGRIVGICVD